MAETESTRCWSAEGVEGGCAGRAGWGQGRGQVQGQSERPAGALAVPLLPGCGPFCHIRGTPLLHYLLPLFRGPMDPGPPQPPAFSYLFTAPSHPQTQQLSRDVSYSSSVT